MALSEDKIRKYSNRLKLSRMRILCDHGFYGLLLMNMKFSVDEKLETAATDGVQITFGTDFLEKLSDRELDFVMMHEILHVVLAHCLRGNDRDSYSFNIACDIVVNSNILLENNMDKKSITLYDYGVSMHTAPDGKEGYEYTAEKVYDMLPKRKNGKSSSKQGGGAASDKNETKGNKNVSWDNHSRWGNHSEDNILRDVWAKRLEDAAKAIEIRDPSNSRGLLPLFAQRMLKELKKSRTDWRTILNDFVSEEVADYSFMPPDRRFSDSQFFLPDFNGTEFSVKNILFMIDTSGSMSDEMITDAYSEVKGAIDRFDGKLQGWLGFFDAAVTEPKPFEDEYDLKIIKPKGGGGTNFRIIFEYVFKYMSDELPACVIILTDGFAPFPEKEYAKDMPVLWIINNKEIEPPWGKTARMEN